MSYLTMNISRELGKVCKERICVTHVCFILFDNKTEYSTSHLIRNCKFSFLHRICYRWRQMSFTCQKLIITKWVITAYTETKTLCTEVLELCLAKRNRVYCQQHERVNDALHWKMFHFLKQKMCNSAVWQF